MERWGLQADKKTKIVSESQWLLSNLTSPPVVTHHWAFATFISIVGQPKKAEGVGSSHSCSRTELAGTILCCGVQILAGDFNMSTLRAAPKLRELGLIANAAACYPWVKTQDASLHLGSLPQADPVKLRRFRQLIITVVVITAPEANKAAKDGN